MPVVNGLLTIHLDITEDDSELVSEFKRIVSASLKRRVVDNAVVVINDNTQVKVPVVASFLDPRHKQLKFFPESEPALSVGLLKNHVHQLITNLTATRLDRRYTF